MFISVIIPVRKISEYLIREGFSAFQKQTNKNFEVIVISDEKNTVGAQHPPALPAAKRWRAGVVPLHRVYPWLKIIQYSGSPSEKRNYGAKHAKGEIIAFIDDDAYPGKNWLKNIIVRAQHVVPLQRNTVAFCGPGIIPKSASFLEQVFDTVLTSKFGSGNFTFRFQKEHPRLVDDYPLMNFAIRKDVFIKLKGLVDHWPGEDSKLCEELVKLGYVIQYTPDLIVYHHRKGTLTDFLLQHSRYGFKRGSFFIDGDNNSRKIVYLLPSLFLMYLLFLPFELRFINQTIFLLPFFGYFLVLLFFIGKLIFKRKGLILSFSAGATMLFMHLIYAIYFIQGFVFRLLKQ
jgi:cellulose synthase/poly-beta-1,6-N-acetylglucosamine synthase-like glycosyltransferase